MIDVLDVDEVNQNLKTIQGASMKIRTILQCLVGFAVVTVLATGPAMANTRIVGSGASFPAPIYTTWFKQFSRANKDIQINYQSKGSGAGIRDFQNGVVDFAASDAAMSEEEMAKVERGV
jgi:phosphate transport system substrate-binding protein